MSNKVISFDPALDPWLTPAQAAAFLGFASKTLANWRSAKTGPAYSVIGRCVRYRYSALVAFQDSAPVEGGVLAMSDHTTHSINDIVTALGSAIAAADWPTTEEIVQAQEALKRLQDAPVDPNAGKRLAAQKANLRESISELEEARLKWHERMERKEEDRAQRERESVARRLEQVRSQNSPSTKAVNDFDREF